MVGAKPMLLWYVWIRLVDGAWHRLDEISKQLRLPNNAIEWAAKFLCDKGMAERGLKRTRSGYTGETPSSRSEEHTSELQSRLHLVCRLLLEKKKTVQKAQ